MLHVFKSKLHTMKIFFSPSRSMHINDSGYVTHGQGKKFFFCFFFVECQLSDLFEHMGYFFV